MARVPFHLDVPFRFSNETSIDDFLQRASKAFNNKDLSRPRALLKEHWVETVGDVRLLTQEGLLRTIGLPLNLVVWMEKELCALDMDAAAMDGDEQDVGGGRRGRAGDPREALALVRAIVGTGEQPGADQGGDGDGGQEDVEQGEAAAGWSGRGQGGRLAGGAGAARVLGPPVGGGWGLRVAEPPLAAVVKS